MRGASGGRTRVTNATIRAVDLLTARWAAEVSGGTVFSAAGVWPLLAFLADGAADEARAELEAALGVPADEAARAGRELLAALRGVPGLEAALGLWTARALELREEWRRGLPEGTHGVLTGDPEADRKALDAWAVERSDGAVPRMPVEPDPRTELVLASALVLRTTWEEPFEGGPGLWRGGRGRGKLVAGLTRTGTGLDAVAVIRAAAGRVTRVAVRGETGVDVHLLLGDERAGAPEVLAAGVDELGGAVPSVPGSLLEEGPAGPGLSVAEVPVPHPGPPELVVDTVAFALTADHDLLRDPVRFGLLAACDTSAGRFPGISADPLALGSARQSVTAAFGADGFRATAVSAMGMMFLGKDAGELPHRKRKVTARFARPFGFLAVHRATRLVLAAGWVTDPKPFPEDEGDSVG
ncbi:hypothetical protein GCM10010266_15180 [Streptomyces griseomycini]|nr:hypothetical protein GCM10010266_15180 [Streptomyces griseomycini]